MTQDEKQLLNKDLCARLPYYVKVAIDFKSYLDLLPDDDIDSEYPYKKNLNTILLCSNKSIDYISQEPHILYSYICTERFGMLRGYDNEAYGVPVELIKPYLRPMWNMTEEEENEYYQFSMKADIMYTGLAYDTPNICVIDWLNAHYFDYRGLISMNLALEAPEEMYNIK